MDQNQHGQPTKGIDPMTQEADGKNQNQSNHMMAPTNPQTQTAGPSAPSPHLREQQYAPQFMYQLQQDHLQQQLNNFWAKKCQEIEETTDFKTHNLPLARIKKIMKADEGVKMVSTEAPMVFAKASEMFIQELTMRAWANTEVNSRRTLQKSDIACAISRSDGFDFLADIVPKDDTVEQEVFAGIPRRGSVLTNNIPSYYMPPHQHVVGPSSSAPRMVMERHVLHQNHNGQQTLPCPTPMMPSPKQEVNHSSNLDD